MRTELTVDQIKSQLILLKEKMPTLYESMVESEMILDIKRQEELSRMDKDTFFDFMMNKKSVDYYQIYPEYVSDVIFEFSAELVESLSNLQIIEEIDLEDLRKKLGKFAKLLALEYQEDRLYTQVPRKTGALMQTGILEYVVDEVYRVNGPSFFVTDIKGFRGILKFYEEQIGLICPQHANSYLLGNTLIVNVENNRVTCPIIAGQYYDVNLPDGDYQVVPIKFYYVEKVSNFKK